MSEWQVFDPADPPEEYLQVWVSILSKNGERIYDKGYWDPTFARMIHRGFGDVTHWAPIIPIPE